MKISLKLGLWFFICMVLIEAISMMFLHSSIIHSRVEQELHSLQSRGNSHRDVLELSSDPSTLHHIGLMESKTDTIVVITSREGKILLASGAINGSIRDILDKPTGNLSRAGKPLQKDWRHEEYIATISPFHGTEKQDGYVYMFRNTDDVKDLISQLNRHFFFAAILILAIMMVTVYFLSRALTKPLITMKEATKKLSKGDFSLVLPPPSKDELGELSESIQALAYDLNYLKKERSEFLATISHELRTPLTYVRGYADIARRPQLNESERLHYLTIIQEESERLTKLIKELFDLAKLDQNNFPIVKERTFFPDFLNGICERMLPAFKNKEIDLHWTCEKNLYLEIDPARFEQALINLLDNALKYSSSGTSTSVEAFTRKGSVILVVKDEGAGIPKEDVRHVFDRLYRVDKSRTRSTGGFGLGLSIVKEIVEAHRGEITVQSEVGAGTAFTIILKENHDENRVVSR